MSKAFDKIAGGLADAIAYAEGDAEKGRIARRPARRFSRGYPVVCILGALVLCLVGVGPAMADLDGSLGQICARGVFAYSVRGRLVDANSGAPVCCVYLDFSGTAVDAANEFRESRARTDADGYFEVELALVEGSYCTCTDSGPSQLAPALRSVRYRIEGSSEWFERVPDTATDQASTGPKFGFEAIPVTFYPSRICEPVCPLPREKLREG